MLGICPLVLAVTQWTCYYLYKSFNAVECPAFRRLLLYLSPEISDGDIPHKDKLKSVVLQLARQATTNIRWELQVSV